MAAPAPAPGGDKKNIIKMAYIYFQEGRWDKAIEEYKKLLVLDPEDVNTHNMLGDVYVKKGAVREAYQEYIKVSDDFSARGQQEKAGIVNKKIATLDSDKLPSDAQQKQALIRQITKAEMAMEQDDLDNAIEAFKSILKLDPGNLQAHAKLAEILARKGVTSEAVPHFMEVGAVFVKNRLYKKAQEIYQKVLELDPKQNEARANLAQIYIKQGSESDAKKEFLNLAESSFAEEDYEKAAQFATKAIEFKSIEAHYILGQALYLKQKYAEAKAEFENLLRFKVNHVGALTNLGMVYIEQNQVDKAAEFILKAAKLEKTNPRTMKALAELHIHKGSKVEAIATLLSLADICVEAKDVPKAIEAVLKATGVDSASIQAHVKLGELYHLSGQNDKAADAFSRVGTLFEAQEKKEKAEEYFKKALELNPSNTEVAKRSSSSGAPPSASATVPTPMPVPMAPAVPRQSAVVDLEADLLEEPALPKAPASVTPVEAMPKPVASQPVTAPVEQLSAVPVPPEIVVPPAFSAPVEKEVEDASMDSEAEFAAQMVITDNLIKQNLVAEAIEVLQQLMEQYPGKAALREKLNQAYTLYVKSGDEVIGAIEAEKKAKEDAERQARAELEKSIREEAEKKVRSEMERKAREDAEKKAREEMDRRTREETARRTREEEDRKAKEEAERKEREESERKAREEVERKDREESERKAQEEAGRKARADADRKAKDEANRKVSMPVPPRAVSAFPTGSTGAKGTAAPDEFMTIAVADIYTRQGLHDEARKIYQKILQMEPDNYEARKKLGDLENRINHEDGKPQAAVSQGATPAEAQVPSVSAHNPESSAEGKDPTTKKRTGRVGYV